MESLQKYWKKVMGPKIRFYSCNKANLLTANAGIRLQHDKAKWLKTNPKPQAPQNGNAPPCLSQELGDRKSVV